MSLSGGGEGFDQAGPDGRERPNFEGDTDKLNAAPASFRGFAGPCTDVEKFGFGVSLAACLSAYFASEGGMNRFESRQSVPRRSVAKAVDKVKPRGRLPDRLAFVGTVFSNAVAVLSVINLWLSVPCTLPAVLLTRLQGGSPSVARGPPKALFEGLNGFLDGGGGERMMSSPEGPFASVLEIALASACRLGEEADTSMLDRFTGLFVNVIFCMNRLLEAAVAVSAG